MRPSLDATWLQVARVISARATCSRLQVGAVLARDGRIIATGWNGAPAGEPHCEHVSDEPCTVSIHAERNVIGFAAREGIATGGTCLYLTHAPCWDCSSVLIAAGVSRVVYGREYKSLDGVLRLRGVGTVVQSEVEAMNAVSTK